MNICQNCGKEFPNRIILDGKVRVLNRRKYCLECSPFGLHNTSDNMGKYRCRFCGETDSRFFGVKRTICSKCRSKYNIERGQKHQHDAIVYLGGICRHCGYDDYESAFDIHHIDPTKKDNKFNQHRGWSWDRLKSELDNCILLCKNCHAAYHHGDIPDEELIKF